MIDASLYAHAKLGEFRPVARGDLVLIETGAIALEATAQCLSRDWHCLIVADADGLYAALTEDCSILRRAA